MQGRRWVLLIGVIAAAISLLLFAAACGGGKKKEATGRTPTVAATKSPQATSKPAATSEATNAAGTPQESAVVVNLAEYRLSAAPNSVPAGMVKFDAKNIGGAEHQLLVIRTDLTPETLPTKSDGSADESGQGVAVVGRIDTVAAGTQQSKPVSLEPGKYVLICNLVDSSGGHYELGMRTAFTVTG